MTSPLLLERSFTINDGRVTWYSALEMFRKFKSVVKVDFYNTMSSAGNWEGYIVQRIRNTYYMILFSQENCYPWYGYNIYTNKNVSASWTTKTPPTKDFIETILQSVLKRYEYA